jgi:protein SCO1/2
MAGIDASRRVAIASLAALLAGTSVLAAAPWDGLNVSASAPPLALTMTDAMTGRMVTAKEFRGKVVLLYLGYTQCPDVCPLTLANIAQALSALGKRARDVRVLFVTVDPNRDTSDLLHRYAQAFAPEVVGLRGSADQLARLGRRYHLSYSVSPGSAGRPYPVMHSAAVYIFGRDGNARWLIPSLESPDADTRALAAHIGKLLDGERNDFIMGLLRWL